MVEVAVRALSPGVNDPFTAIVVIDRLRGCLTRLAGRRLPMPVLCDASGRVRLVRETTSFGGVMDAALHQIRQAGAGHPAVVIHMLEALARIAEHARRPEQREAIARHVRMVAAAGLREAAEPGDRGDIERSVARAERALRAEERPATPRRGRTAPLPAALGVAEGAPGG
nr:DUF2254 family protein [Roseicella aerolata]